MVRHTNFAHSNTDYSLMQTSDGETLINSSSGKPVADLKRK